MQWFASKRKNDVISTPHPLASLAGKEMFSQNGNAFDAAVAAAFTLAVVEPSMSGIGGRLQVIYNSSEGIKGITSTEVPRIMSHRMKEVDMDIKL